MALSDFQLAQVDRLLKLICADTLTRRSAPSSATATGSRGTG